jgi:uncharacterized integral membrane protein (TIGR00698 family)
VHPTLSAPRRLAPGLLTALVIGIAATFVSGQYGGPQFLYALFFGIAFNFLAANPATQPGVEVASRTILRLGVALLGARITLDEIAGLGWPSILTVVLAVLATLAFGAWLARLMARPASEGLLTGGAVAICGASAALALAAVLPKGDREARFTLLTVVGVTLLSTVAMVVYPAIVSLAGLDDRAAGLFIGGTIHDVAQVVGAGYTVSATAGDHAVFVKLLRVAMLLPVVLALSFMFRSRADDRGQRQPLLPWFLVAFAVLVAAASAGWIPQAALPHLSSASRWCLVVAIAALGIKTSFRDFASLGWRPVILMVSETLFLAGLVLAALLARNNVIH